jgi:DnaJ-class molecular chaperone
MQIIECAFCDARGIDPFDIPSPLSKCQVCGGKGVVTVREPTMICPECGRIGKAQESKLPCLRCDGKGVIEVII